MQFNLTNQKCKLANFNARSELNGEDHVPAADLKLSTMIPALLVGGDPAPTFAQFGPDLAAAFYDGTRLRNPKLEGPFGFDDECIGASVIIHYGTGGPSDLTLTGTKVNNFKLWPQDGGAVLLEFRVQCHPDEKCAGKLYGLIQEDVDVTIAPAQASLNLDEPKG